MINLIGGKLYQWDTGRKVRVSVDCKPVSEVHFSTLGEANALVVLPYETEKGIVANIPNILLQNNLGICVYVVSAAEDGESTITKRTFTVATRPKPEDYICTETEVLSYTSLDKRMKALEENGGSVKTVNGEGPDENGNIEVVALPDNAEQIEMLIEADLLPAVYDADGKILTDENGNIVLRY